MDQPLTTPDGSRVEPFGAGTAKASNAPVGLVAKALAKQQDVGDFVVEVVERDLGSTESRDRAVPDVGTERLVHVMEPGDDLSEAAWLWDGVADVDRDGRAHHVFDVVEARPWSCGGRGHQTIAVRPAALAASMADWSDRR